MSVGSTLAKMYIAASVRSVIEQWIPGRWPDDRAGALTSDIVDAILSDVLQSPQFEWGVLDDDVLETWPSEQAARQQMHSPDARLVSRVVSEWVDAG